MIELFYNLFNGFRMLLFDCSAIAATLNFAPQACITWL
jgi:hypothetical protein